MTDALLAVQEGEDCKQAAEDLRSEIMNLWALQMQLARIRAHVQERLEKAGPHLSDARMLVLGLPEEDAEDGHTLRRVVDAQVVQAARQQGLTSDAVLEVRRLSASTWHADRSWPVLVQFRTIGDKHRAFKARSAVRYKGIILQDYLTAAQQEAKRSQMAARRQLLEHPGANPHFRGSQLYYWSDGLRVPYIAAAHGQSAQVQRACVADMLAAIEANLQRQRPVNDFTAQMAEIEMLDFQLQNLRAKAQRSLDAADVHAPIAIMTIWGLPEQGAEDGQALRLAVDAQVVYKQPVHGGSPQMLFMEVMRVQRPPFTNPATDPRPVSGVLPHGR